MDTNFKNSFKEANKIFALKGERIIGLAYTDLDPNTYNKEYAFDINLNKEMPETNFPINNLCFVGLISMEDPPKLGVKEAISICKQAGIKVIMVTGDQTLTAASIAYQVGIIENLDDAPEIIKDRQKLATIEEAEKRSNVIVVNLGCYSLR
jgi:sodium/potassium-transporting ATPase subunit alpha